MLQRGIRGGWLKTHVPIMRTRIVDTAAFVMAVIVSAGVLARPAQEDFPIVRGTGYEGAIVPASSPWHTFHRLGLPPGATSSEAWTPSPADIATLESALAALLTAGAPDRSPSPVADIAPGIMGLPWLRQNVQTLKRQYFGIHLGTTRHILVRAFPERSVGNTWRSEVTIFTDGGCGNVWFDFQVESRRIVRVKCAGTA
jgi:hypothetical protein